MRKLFKRMTAFTLAAVMTFSNISPSILSNAATIKVTNVDEVKDSSGNHFTARYTLTGGIKAFCCECYEASPEKGMSMTVKELTSHSNLSKIRKIMYYGIGGPESELKDTDENMKLMASALSEAYCGKNHNDYYLSWYKKVIKYDAPPESFKVYICNAKGEDGGDYQKLMYSEYEPEGKLRVRKVSADTKITKNNSCYSLEGAKFGVYSTKTDAKNKTNRVALLTTKANGYSNYATVDEGTYYLRELTAPKGYVKDETIRSVKVEAEGTQTVEIANTPANDPLGIEITKKNSGNAYVNNIPSLEGTQFTVKYYDGYYTEATLPSEATRTWIIQTKAAQYNNQPVYIASLTDTYKVTGDAFYYQDNQVVLPLGTISIEETQPANGYTLNGGYLQVVGGDGTKFTGKYVAQITGSDMGNIVLQGGNEFTGVNNVYYGGVGVKKVNADTNEPISGAKIAVRNKTGATIIVNGKQYANGETITTLTTDKNGEAKTDKNLLPFGKYEIEEIETVNGFKLEGSNLKQEITVNSEGQIHWAGYTMTNATDKGGLTVQKVDAELQNLTDVEAVAQGKATLEGTKVAVINNNSYKVKVNGKVYSKGETVLTLTTDKEGKASTGNKVLPYGTYLVKEVAAPKGYKLSDGANQEQSVKIEKDGVVVKLGNPIENKIIRGGIEIQKFDAETGKPTPLGSGTFEGIEYTIRSLNDQPVIIDGKVYNKGETVAVVTTDKNGYAATEKNLPYGDYEVEETAVPESYQMTGTGLKQTVTVSEENVFVQVKVSNDVTRGDFELTKIEHYSERKMANVEFKITSNTTGESHVIKTDENGYFSSASSYRLHSAEDGLWFGMDKDENKAPVNDEVGAMPYDTYTIEELRCDANEMTDLYTGEFTITKHGVTINLGTIENYERKIWTSAKDSETGDNYATPDGKVIIVDTVSYQGLFVGETYKVEGVLMDKLTGKELLDVDGNQITASTTFVPEEREGTVDVTFQFDASKMAGGITVVYETLFDANGDVAAEHKDIEDKEQTIYFPEIKTSMTDQEGSKTLYMGQVTLVDTVTYVGLETGKEYVMNGTLMDKETGKAVLDKDGKEITASTKFVPETKDGTVDVTFVFDTTTLAGRTLVAFESLEKDGKVYAVHTDIEDEAQTVYVPEIKTTLKDEEGYNVILAGPITLVDTVSYTGLEIGKEYTMNGTLMDKETEKAVLDADGNEITASTKFIPETQDGTVDVVFTFDATIMKGKTLVAFESLEKDGKVYAVHTDIEDEAQTVYVPKIGTLAYDKKDKDQNFVSKGTATIIDEVSYENLTAGETYVVRGVLMDKTTEKPLLVNKKQVTVEKEFVAEDTDGTVKVEFKFDASSLGTKSVVVFEEVYQKVVVPEQVDEDGNVITEETTKERLIAEHKDIKDEGQTVEFRPPVKTGDNMNMVPWLCALGLSMAGVAAVYTRRKKERQ